MLRKIPHNFFIAIEAIYQNKFRALLTSLGILFGVASVIAMLAIGKGAQEEILQQMKLLGTNNIIVTPVIEQKEEKVAEEDTQQKEEKKRFSPGLTLEDAQSIALMIPHVEFASPEVVFQTMAIHGGLRRSINLVGVLNEYFLTSNFSLRKGGLFTTSQMEYAHPVCVIGSGVKAKFFPREDPVGKRIKCGSLWLTIIGILEERQIPQNTVPHLGVRDYNMDIYAPVQTVLLRYKNRALITKKDILAASHNQGDNTSNNTNVNSNQIDRIIIRVADSKYISGVANIIGRMLQRRHNNVVDYQVVVPELLLAQEQRTRTIFNIVLGAIASISLIVGGIGIMNIMLASVMERIKEIGIRLSIGATQQDIVLQFLGEAIAISITGGFAGILLGMFMSYGIERFAGITTIVSPIAVIISFVVSISVGLIFGIFPAKKAATQDPIVSLRYE